MKTWKAIFADDPENLAIVEGNLGDDALDRFSEAATFRKLNGREIAGMWIIDEGTEQGDVIAVFGKAPHEIHIRHAAWRASR